MARDRRASARSVRHPPPVTARGAWSAGLLVAVLVVGATGYLVGRSKPAKPTGVVETLAAVTGRPLPSIFDTPVTHRGTRRTVPGAGSHDAKAAAGSGAGGGNQRVGHPRDRAVEWSGAAGEDDASRFLRLTAHGDDLDAVG
jgi:hypothetical protein